MGTNSDARGTRPALVHVSQTDTLTSWLAEHPHALVGAVTPAGAPTELPHGITLGEGHQMDNRSLLELVVPEDTKSVADAFVAALTRGIGLTTIHMASDPLRPMALKYVDLREAYGVLLRIVDSAEGQGEAGRTMSASDFAPARPRLGAMTKDEVAKVLSIDTALSLMLGWGEMDMVGHQNLEFIHPDDHIRAIDNWMSGMSADQTATVKTVRLRYLCKDGSWLWLETSNEWRTEADGTTVVVARLFDVSEEMAAVEALRYNENFLRRLTDTVPVGLFHIASNGSIEFVNPVLRAMIGDHEVSTQGELADALLAGQSSLLHEAIAGVLASGEDSDLNVALAEHDQRSRAVCRINLRAIADEQVVLGVLGCVVDVTELRSIADTDPLTGLQNRRSIMESLESNLLSHDGQVAALYLDLDHFKPVNDRHGHHVGDLLLRAVAERLREGIRMTDQVGRHGGDEFLVVCPGIGTQADAIAMAHRIRAVFKNPFQVGGVSIAMTASIGVACGERGTRTDDLVASADRAMYDAKQNRGGPPAYCELATLSHHA